MNEIRYVKIQDSNGILSENIPFGVDAKNVTIKNGSDLDTVINLINNKIGSLASGSPLVADSIEEMIDTTRIYVNTTDGYWYYYNCSEWVAGGVYQSTEIPDYSIGNSKIKPKDISINNFDYYDDLLSLAIETKYNTKISGYDLVTFLPIYNENSSFNTYIFNMSSIEKYKSVTNKYGYDNSVTYQALIYFSENSKASNHVSTGLNENNNIVNYSPYEKFALCIPKNNLYFRSHGEYISTGDVIKDISYNTEINDINVKETISGNKIDLKRTDLINHNGVTVLKNRKLAGYDSNYEIATVESKGLITVIVDKTVFTNFATLRDIRFKLSESLLNTTNVVVGVNKTTSKGFNFTKNALITNFASHYDEENRVYNWGSFIANDLYYMNSFEKIAFCLDISEAELYTEAITELNTNFSLFDKLNCTVNCFNSIGAIGDSYTAASVKHSDGTWTDQTNQSYIATIGKRAGIEWSNYGVGGATTRDYLTDINGMAKVLNSNANDFYFLALGINDSEKLGINYLGSINDIKEDYTQNSDTFYGNYGKIISQVLEHSPKAKLCMILIPLKGEVKTLFNNAIIEIANHFGIPYINPFDDMFFNSSLYNTKIEGHPTCIGYVGMGLAYERLLSKCMSENVNYFLYSTVG